MKAGELAPCELKLETIGGLTQVWMADPRGIDMRRAETVMVLRHLLHLKLSDRPEAVRCMALHKLSMYRKVINCCSASNEDACEKANPASKEGVRGTRLRMALQPPRGGRRPIKYVARIKYVKYVIRRRPSHFLSL